MENLYNTFKKYVTDKKKLYVILIIIALVALLFGLIISHEHQYKEQLSNNKNINIIFNTDINYKDFTKVAIQSAIFNKNPESVYNINVLCVDLTNAQCEEFKKFDDRTNNVNIKLIPLTESMLNQIDKYEINNRYVSRADLFKFFFPEILPDVDKVLYIDGDTLVFRDLSELYNTDMRRYSLAAVKKSTDEMKSYDIRLLPGNLLTYHIYTKAHGYNCGVLLFNLKKFRENHLTEKLIKAKNNDETKRFQTEAAFNEVIPYRKIKHLSPIYNAIAHPALWDFKDTNIDEFKKIYQPFIQEDITTMKDFYDTAVIVHFVGGKKPWSCNTPKFFDEWWRYANMVNPNWKYGKDFITSEDKK